VNSVTSSQVQGYNTTAVAAAAALHARQPDCATSLLFFRTILSLIITTIYYRYAGEYLPINIIIIIIIRFGVFSIL